MTSSASRNPSQITIQPILALAALCGIAALCGCRPARPANDLDIPTRGSVRVLSRQIERTDRQLHWKWSVIGERNWRKPAARNADLFLADTYPINDAEQRGGCNIWECDLTAEKTATGVQWTAALQGSDGASVQSHGVVAADGSRPLDDLVPIRLDSDTQMRLAADVPLAGLGDRTLTLHIAR